MKTNQWGNSNPNNWKVFFTYVAAIFWIGLVWSIVAMVVKFIIGVSGQ